MRDMTVRVDTACPFRELIHQAIASEFPTQVMQNSNQVLDAVTDELLASGQVRFGPKPSPEGIVAIRQIVRTAIDRGEPIPVLSPWGSKKPVNTASVDIAEVYGLRTLMCLQSRVSKIYDPGLQLNVRVEDIGGLYLFDDEGDDGRRANDKYVEDFVKLHRIIGASSMLNLVLESSIVTERQYVNAAYELVPLFLTYIKESDVKGIENYQEFVSWQALNALGWRGAIDPMMRDFYRSRYAKFYGSDHADATYRLAKYMAGSMARHHLKMTGADPNWDYGHVQVTFANQIPGDPRMNVIAYRTMPTKFTRDHIAPWRAHGIYRIYNDNSVKPTVVSHWGDDNTSKHVVELSNDGESVSINADYVVMD